MLLHSDVARLVLGYLAEENCPLTYQSFVNESIHLKEMKDILLQEFENGSPTTIFGKSLCLILNEYYTLKDAEAQFMNFKNKPHRRKQKFLLMWKKLEEAMTAVKSFQVASILDGFQSKKNQCVSCEHQITQNGAVVTQSAPSDFLWNDKPALYRHLLPETDERGVFKEGSVFQAPSVIEKTDSLIQAACNRRKKRLGFPKRLNDVERKNKVAQSKPDASNFILQNIAGSEGMAVVGATIMTQMKKCAQTEKPLDTSPTESSNIAADAAKLNQESIAQMSLESLLQSDFTTNAIEFGKELEDLLELEDRPMVQKTASLSSLDTNKTDSEPDPKLFILGNPVVVNLPRQADSRIAGPNSPSLSEALLIPSTTVASFDNFPQPKETNVEIPAFSPPVDFANTEVAITDPMKKSNTFSASATDRVEIGILHDAESLVPKIEEETKTRNCNSQKNSPQKVDTSSNDARTHLSPMETIIPSCDTKIDDNKYLIDDPVVETSFSTSFKASQIAGAAATSNPPSSSHITTLHSSKATGLCDEISVLDIEQNGQSTSLLEEKSNKKFVSSYTSPKKTSNPMHLDDSPAKSTRSKSKLTFTRTRHGKKNTMPKIKMKPKYKDKKKKLPTKSPFVAKKDHTGSEISCQAELQLNSCSAQVDKTGMIFSEVEQLQPQGAFLNGASTKCSPSSSVTGSSPENILVAVSLQSVVTSPRKLTLRYGLRSTDIDSSKAKESPFKGKELFDDRPTCDGIEASAFSSNLAEAKEDLINGLLVGCNSNVEKVDDVIDVVSTDLSEMKTVSSIPDTPSNVNSTSSTESQTHIQPKSDSNTTKKLENFTVPKSGVLVVSEHQNLEMNDILKKLTEQVKKAKEKTPITMQQGNNVISMSKMIPTSTIAVATATSTIYNSTPPELSFSSVSQAKSDVIAIDCATIDLPNNGPSKPTAAPVAAATKASHHSVSASNIIAFSFAAAAQSPDVLPPEVSSDCARTNNVPVSIDDTVFADLCKKDITGSSLTTLLNETSLTQMIDAAKDMQEYAAPVVQQTTPEKPNPSCNRFRTISPSAGVFSVFDTDNSTEARPVATTSACEPKALKSETEEATQNLKAWLNGETTTHPGHMPESVRRPLSFTQPVIRRPRYRKLIPKPSVEGTSGTYALSVRSQDSNFSGAIKKTLLIQNDQLDSSNQRLMSGVDVHLLTKDTAVCSQRRSDALSSVAQALSPLGHAADIIWKISCEDDSQKGYKFDETRVFHSRASNFTHPLPSAKSPIKRKSRTFAKNSKPVRIGFPSSINDRDRTCDIPARVFTVSSTVMSLHRSVTPQSLAVPSSTLVGVPLHSLLTNPCNHLPESSPTVSDEFLVSKSYVPNTRVVSDPSINVSSIPTATVVSTSNTASTTFRRRLNNISSGFPSQNITSLNMSTKMVSSVTALPKLATKASPSVKKLNQTSSFSVPSLPLTDSDPVPSHTTSISQAVLSNTYPETTVVETVAKDTEENSKRPSAETADDFSYIASSEEGHLRILTSDEEKTSPASSISSKKRKINSNTRSKEDESKRQRYDIQGMSEVDIVQLLNELHGKKSEKRHLKKHKKHKKKSKKKDKSKKKTKKLKSVDFASESSAPVSQSGTLGNKAKSFNDAPVSSCGTSLAMHEIAESSMVDNNIPSARKKHKKVSSKKIVSISPLKTENRGKRRVSLTSIPIPPSKLGGSPLHLRTPSPAVCRDSPKTIALVAESLVELSRSHGTVHNWKSVGDAALTGAETQRPSTQAQHSESSPCSRTGSSIPESSNQSSVFPTAPPILQSPKKKSRRKLKKLSLENLDISKFLSTLDYE